MRKKLSGLGILLMLILKHPPMPDFSIFQREDIVAVRTCSLKQVAVDFKLN